MRAVASMLVCGFAVAAAQTSAPPSFEVASVKAVPPSEQVRPGGMQGVDRPGQFIATHTSLRNLILTAYDVAPYQSDLVSGLPPDRNLYDIEAKVPAGTNRERFRAMLQNLLAERFGVVVHWVEKEVPGYDLVVAKGGPKLQEAEKRPADAPQGDTPPLRRSAGGWPVLPPGIPNIGLFGAYGNPITHLAAKMQTVADLIHEVQLLMDRPLIDKTGLTGTYDFTLDFAAPGNAAYPPPPSESSDVASEPAPDMFAALERQLGLKLVSSRPRRAARSLPDCQIGPTPVQIPSRGWVDLAVRRSEPRAPERQDARPWRDASAK